MSSILKASPVLLVLLCLTVYFSCKTPKENSVIIGGELGFIDKKYYEIDTLTIKLKDLQGSIDHNVSYPQMYRFLLESNTKQPFNKGFVFIDPSTKVLKIDTIFNACPMYEYSDNNQEYRHKFIPYYYKSNFAECKDIISNVYVLDKQIDSILTTYIIDNPDSYVALWHLLERVNVLGFSDMRRTALNNFSDQLKISKIWKLLKEDMDRFEVYSLGKVLPQIEVKNPSLEAVYLDFSELKAKYTLVEFWFSRCKPCHYKFKKLIPLHKQYKVKGFDVVSISSDPTKDISMWQDHLKKYNFDWLDYLDEDKIEAKKMNINSYPHSFLLNKKGEIVLIDPSTKKLEGFLKQSLDSKNLK